MLTRNQLCVLLPELAGYPFNNLTKICLFGPPDPAETRRLLEEQFLMDREYMLRRYGFDIASGSLVTGICSTKEEDEATEIMAVTASHGTQSSFLVRAATKEEVEKPYIPESEVRHRSGNCSPCSRQMRITGNMTVYA